MGSSASVNTTSSKPASEDSADERSVVSGDTRAPSNADTKETGSGASGATGGSTASGASANPRADIEGSGKPVVRAVENMLTAKSLWADFQLKNGPASAGTEGNDEQQK